MENEIESSALLKQEIVFFSYLSIKLQQKE